MKIFLSLAAALSGLLALTSCNGDFQTRVYDENKKFALKEGATDSLSVGITVEYPERGMSGEAMKNMSDTLTVKLFGDEFAGFDVNTAIAGYIESAVVDYRESNLSLYEDMQAEGVTSASLNWEIFLRGEISGSHGDIISYTSTAYSYTGGAHGMTVLTSLNFDMKTGTILTEGDFFTDGYEKPLSAMLTAHLPEAFEDPETVKSIFVSEISPNGNFCVSEKGITYIYNQYEIAPYALGVIKVTVPWEEVQGIMKK